MSASARQTVTMTRSACQGRTLATARTLSRNRAVYRSTRFLSKGPFSWVMVKLRILVGLIFSRQRASRTKDNTEYGSISSTKAPAPIPA